MLSAPTTSTDWVLRSGTSACSGTINASMFSCISLTVSSMPARRRPSGFGNSERTPTVRLTGSTRESTEDTVP